jgi:catechol 2,3-dioxygenase-like lactoylglutathione lyase family enzyme
MKARGVSWVGMKTEQFDAMKGFFRDVVGLPSVVEREDFVVFLYPNGDKVELFGPNAGNPPEQFGTSKVMTSILVEDMDAALAELRAAGIELIGGPGFGSDGYIWQHFRAPDGKEFELVVDPAHA